MNYYTALTSKSDKKGAFVDVSVGPWAVQLTIRLHNNGGGELDVPN